MISAAVLLRFMAQWKYLFQTQRKDVIRYNMILHAQTEIHILPVHLDNTNTRYTVAMFCNTY